MIGLRARQRLLELLGERCQFDVSMADLTTWRVGGPADCLVRPLRADEIAAVIRIGKEENEPVRVVGAGSNLLILDGGLRGITILMRQGFDTFAATDRPDGAVRLVLGAALPVETVTERCVAEAITGLEFVAGVPGSVGGGVRMNAGTYLGTFADVLQEVEVVTEAGKVRRIGRDKLVYRYRGLDLEGPYVVTEAVVQVKRGDHDVIAAQVEAIIAKRRERQPWDCASCGSTFKNPEGHHAGRLIEEAGLKGHRIGNAQVSEKHANFIINLGGATAVELLELIAHVRQTVFARTGAWLEPEVKIWGDVDVPE